MIGLFPSDHVIADEENYRETLQKGIAIAAAGENIVVLGIRPTRAETGYGYIEVGAAKDGDALRVRRFTEKPDARHAEEFVKAGNYFWNSGMFLWSARTLANALSEHLPKTAALLEQNRRQLWNSESSPAHSRVSIPSAKTSASTMPYSSRVRPRASRLQTFFVFPPISAGTIWAPGHALHEHQVARQHPANDNLITANGIFTLNAKGNYIHAPGKFVAVVGVNDLVVVETDDALLITTREHAQDVGKVVKYLDEKKLNKLV